MKNFLVFLHLKPISFKVSCFCIPICQPDKLIDFNISCPHHQIFKNRNLGDFITFVVNPRENFDYVANGNKKQGISIRKIIRNRVKKYNKGYLPQSLGFFGSKDNFEWKQYTLDENYLHSKQKTFSQCPLKIFKRNPK